MDKSKKLALMDNKEQITSLALGGKHPKEIAQILDLAETTVKKYLDEALEEAKAEYQDNTARLLAKSYMRADKLLDRLMEKFENLAARGDEFIDLALVDRIDKLINTQTKMLTRNQPVKVQHQNDPNNPMGNQIIFFGSPEYNRAVELATEDPQFLIIEPKEQVFEEYLDEYSRT